MSGDQWLKLGLLVACLVLAAIAMLAWRGDGNHRKRRCGACGYDMANTKSRKCPECAHEAASELGMYGPRPYLATMKWSLRLLVVSAIVLVWTAIPGTWTQKTPGPVLKLMLATVPDAPKSANGVTIPTAVFATSKNVWEREIWNDQAAQALRDATLRVRVRSGEVTADDVAELIGMMHEIRAINREAGNRPWKESWQFNDAIDDLVAEQRAACAQHPESATCERLTWLLSEVSFDAAFASKLPRWAKPPEVVVRRAFEHTDPAVRLEAVQWYGRLLHIQLMNPEMIAPDFRAELRKAAEDQNVALRTAAESVGVWGEGFGLLPREPDAPDPAR